MHDGIALMRCGVPPFIEVGGCVVNSDELRRSLGSVKHCKRVDCLEAQVRRKANRFMHELFTGRDVQKKSESVQKHGVKAAARGVAGSSLARGRPAIWIRFRAHARQVVDRDATPILWSNATHVNDGALTLR
ncbi:hypothetical protein [Piscinibacter sp. XHJ-5]|uniref:hypothetical protein n=1 Tax=Piscinibacter sp. XHJ-5 TaxID=3037797 RepID=UPI00245310A4|nr:hypothetical protein [Piscinibacter sp. XHJ-5]